MLFKFKNKIRNLQPTTYNLQASSAFTVLELVVVLAIMSIVTVMVVSVTISIKTTNRDNKRVSDVRSIQTALEMYYRDAGTYPRAITDNMPIALDATHTYLTKVPTGPAIADGACAATTTYVYSNPSPYTSYVVTFCLGSRSGDIGPGTNYAVPGEIVTCVPDCYLACNAAGSAVSDGCSGTCSAPLTSCPGGYTCTNNHCIPL